MYISLLSVRGKGLMANLFIRCSKGEICVTEDSQEGGYAMLGVYSFEDVSYTLRGNSAEFILKDLNLILCVTSDEEDNWTYAVRRDDTSKEIGVRGWIIIEDDVYQDHNLCASVEHTYSPLRLDIKA